MIDQTIAGRYKIVKPLGAGGMGETFIAIDTQFPDQLQCVVKRLLPASNDPSFLSKLKQLFFTEAKTLAKLGEHDQIPRLLAYLEENQEFYLVQEYIEGHTLGEELKQRWKEAQVLVFLKDILIVLEFLQNQDPQVIHRDIKPDNIIRRKQDGKLVLIDFGAVKEWQAKQLTLMGQPTLTIGTPEYMPTEQFKGLSHPSSDLYAVGMIAIQALTGILPSVLEDDENGEKIWRHKASVSDELANFLAKMARHYYKHRYQTASEASQVLQNLMSRAATVAASPPIILENAKRSSALPTTVYQEPQNLVVTADPPSQSRRTFLKRLIYIVLGTIGALSTSFLGLIIAFK